MELSDQQGRVTSAALLAFVPPAYLPGVTELPEAPADLPSLVRSLAEDTLWVADVVPLLYRDAEEPEARHAFVLVTAGPVRLVADLLVNPAADNAAHLVATAIRAAAGRAAATPRQLVVRGESLAARVQHQLNEWGLSTEVIPVDTFADLFGAEGDEFVADALALRRAMDGETILDAPAAVAARWAAWGVSLSAVAAFFTAAA